MDGDRPDYIHEVLVGDRSVFIVFVVVCSSSPICTGVEG